MRFARVTRRRVLFSMAGMAPGVWSLRQRGMSGFPRRRTPLQAPWNRTSPSSGWSNLNDVIADIVEMTHPRWKDEAEKNGVREETIVRPRAERERAFEPFFTTKGGEAGWGSAWSTQS